MSHTIDDDEIEQAVARSIAQAPRYPDIRLTGVTEECFDPSADIPSVPDAATDAATLRVAAVNGSPEAQVAWGHFLLAGHGVSRDAEAAVRWFQIAARSGNADAFNMVGRCHERGWGVPVNPAEAARWYGLAADQSHAWAQYNLAVLLALGMGVATDRTAALSLLVKSARQGNAKAMHMIGRFRELGHVRKAKLRSAALWYRWAAVRGCFRGQFHHACQLAASGDIDAASRWFKESLAHAPQDFRQAAAEILSRHSDPVIRQLGIDFELSASAGSAH